MLLEHLRARNTQDEFAFNVAYTDTIGYDAPAEGYREQWAWAPFRDHDYRQKREADTTRLSRGWRVVKSPCAGIHAESFLQKLFFCSFSLLHSWQLPATIGPQLPVGTKRICAPPTVIFSEYLH